MGPYRAMLVGQMDICVRYFFWLEQAVICTTRVAQLLEEFWSEYLTERVRRVDRSVDERMGNMDALRRILCI